MSESDYCWVELLDIMGETVPSRHGWNRGFWARPWRINHVERRRVLNVPCEVATNNPLFIIEEMNVQ